MRLQQLLMALLVATSCNETKKEIKPKSKYEIHFEKVKRLDSINLREAEILSKKYNAISGWDTLRNFTYSIQELFESNTSQISFDGVIKDIVKRDSSYILKVAGKNQRFRGGLIAEISVTPSLFNDLKLSLHPSERNRGCFIFKGIKITTSQPILSSEIDVNGENIEDATSYLTLDFENSVIKFKGQLVAYYLFKNVEDNY